MVAVPSRLITLDFDESQHPRDNHGRFGQKGGDTLSPLAPSPPFQPFKNDPGYTQAGRDLLITRPDGSKVPFDRRLDENELALAKDALVRDVAGRMTTEPMDMMRAVGTGDALTQGRAAEKIWDEIHAKDPTGPTTAELVERLRADPNMVAEITMNRDLNDGVQTVYWQDVTEGNRTPGEAKLQRELLLAGGFVPGDSPEVDDAIRYAVVNQMVREWSGTSNDASTWSLTLQDTAAKEFGLKGSAPWDTSLMQSSLTDEYRKSVEPVQRDFLRSMYANTQDYLKANGVERVTLSRGFNFYDETMIPDWAKHEGATDVPLRPLSSWSGDPDMAIQFAGNGTTPTGGAVIAATVPADRILATARTGIGALSEDEFVVLGGTERVKVTVPALTDDAEPFAASAAADRAREQATRNEDWLRTLRWDLPTDPAQFAPGELAHLAALPAGEAMPAELRDALVASGDFDEGQHPRDSHGRFGEKGDSDEHVLGVGTIRPTLGPGRLPHRVTANDIDESAINWQYYNPCANARYAAECMLGQDHPTVPDFSSLAQTTGDYGVLKSLEAGEMLGSDDDKTQLAVDDAHNLLVGVRDAPWSDVPLFRGVPLEDDQPGTAALRALGPGDTFDLSLASFSNDRNTAEQFAQGGPPPVSYRDPGPWPAGTSRMMFTLADGGKGAATDSTEIEVHVGGRVIDSGDNIGNYEGGSWERGHNDVVVGGRLEVVAVRPYTPEAVNAEPSKTTVEVVVRQVGVFDPDHDGELVPVKQHAMAAASGPRSSMYHRAPFWQTFGPGPTSKHGSAPVVAAGDFDESKHPRDDHGRFGEGSGGTDVDALLAANPQQPGEADFTYQSRIVAGLKPEARHELLFRMREKYEPCAYLVAAADRWRASHDLPDPNINLLDVRAPLDKGEEVALTFEQTPDESNDPRVQAAFDDFKRQNEEMYAFVTRPESAGGCGVTVDFAPNSAGDPYPSAAAQADDLRDNQHITIQSGLGGEHTATMTTAEYDRFRAVHDVFGHAAVGGGFDRHGEYEAYLQHRSMYTGSGAIAMASEYHGINTALWAGAPGTPGTGKSILLPDDLVQQPWDEKGNLVALARAGRSMAKNVAPKPPAKPVQRTVGELAGKLGLDASFAGRFDHLPWHYDESAVVAAGDFDEAKHPRDSHGRFGDKDGSVTAADITSFSNDDLRDQWVHITTKAAAAAIANDGFKVQSDPMLMHGAKWGAGVNVAMWGGGAYESAHDMLSSTSGGPFRHDQMVTVIVDAKPDLKMLSTEPFYGRGTSMDVTDFRLRKAGLDPAVYHANDDGGGFGYTHGVAAAARAAGFDGVSDGEDRVIFDPENVTVRVPTTKGTMVAAGDFDEAKHPRDEKGRFGDKTGERPEFPDSHKVGVAKLALGKAGYNRTIGLPPPAKKDWQAITADPARGARIADDYAALPDKDPAALESYTALRDEVAAQYEYLTKTVGVNVEIVNHDPYASAAEMIADVRGNNRLQVLATAETGPHPFFTNDENDQFRAVHDAFGHAAIGRGFDRNGEEAAYQSHRQMFSEPAIRALATETRGQNSSLVFGGTGTFPPQKVALLPEMDIAAAMQAQADADNLYELTRCHHTSLGRTLADRRLAAAGDFDESKHPRDAHGRFGEKGGTDGLVEITVPTRLADVPPDVRAEIADRATGAGVDPSAELNASWRNHVAWDQILTSQAKELADPQAAHPDRYEPNKGYGYHLKDGETETRIAFHPEDGTQPPRVFDVTPAPKGMNVDEALATGRLVRTGSLLDPLLTVPGSERRPESVYRVMATGEYDQAKERGYIKTDERMNLGADEGTVTSLRSTGSFYVPTPRDGASDYRIARIDYRDEDGWRLDTDEYVKTDKRVPFDRISAVTEPLPNPRADEARPT